MELPSLQISLLLFDGGVVYLVNALTSLDSEQEPSLGVDLDDAAFLFPLPESELVSAPPWPSAASIPGIRTPREVSPTCRTTTSMSFSVGIIFNNIDLTSWSIKIGKQDGRGLMTLSEIESELNFDNIMSNTFRSKSVPWSCSSRMASFTLVYNQAV
jgi:hypothetical protein